MKKCSEDFDITGGDLMETFLGMQVEQSNGNICLQLDNYVQDIVTEYLKLSGKMVRLKGVLSQPRAELTQED
jgi:hypothetical protein